MASSSIRVGERGDPKQCGMAAGLACCLSHEHCCRCVGVCCDQPAHCAAPFYPLRVAQIQWGSRGFNRQPPQRAFIEKGRVLFAQPLPECRRIVQHFAAESNVRGFDGGSRAR